MVQEIRLPPLGQTSDEMSIIEWYKAEGDSIMIAEPLLCVETDKAQVDVESAEEGILLKIIARPGESLSSGALLAYVGAAGETIPEADADASPQQAVVPVTAAISHNSPGPRAPESGRAQALPIVRKLAARLGIDLKDVAGSGPGGRVERSDVEAAGKAAVGAPGPAAGSSEVSAVRRAIARRLTQSVQTIPHFTIDAQVNAGRAKQFLTDSALPGLTYTHLLLRVLARAAREHPAMLRVWSNEGPSFRTLPTPNIGLAVAGNDALYLVTIAEPDRLALPALVAMVKSAAERGRTGSLNAADQRPAALSVSNLGMFGVDSFHAIIDPDQTAMVAVGAVQDRVAAVDGAPVVIPQLTVSVSFDHRAVDGTQGAQFLQSVRQYFERDPAGESA